MLGLSCSKEEMSQRPGDEKYERIGQLHNEGLDFVLDRLSASQTKGGSGLTREQAMAVVMEAVTAYLENHGIPTDQVRPEVYCGEEYDGAGLTDEQKELYDELIGAIRDPLLDYESTQKAVSLVEARVAAALPTQEAEPLLCGIAVARYSMEYWYNHADEWELLAGLDNLAYQPMTKAVTPESDEDDLSWKDLVEADAGGAVVGAIAGGGAGALAGGLTASAADGVGQLIDKIL